MVSAGGRTRALLIALAAALSLGAGILACTAGDEVAYAAPDVGSEAGLDGADDGGRFVGEGSVAMVSPQNDGGVLPTPAPIACAGLDSGCDPSAGKGCCLVSVNNDLGDKNACFDQVQHFGGPKCNAPGDVFLSCLSSDGDSLCCWHKETDGTSDTRFRVDCRGGVEACNPGADGGACATGGPCTQATCKGVVVGYCGGGAAPCQP